ncbi:transcriptional regulator [Bacillus sp. FJAT-27264]|uniref:LysR family transcriptional regulator n=1 Tax=Paenibacillus sp. (strain DSM 101736 / FJAT-27264) TaxID=1850362 RepID=UPI000808076E|nr:LysR family transcriptional regulator [Bacillus sp. FJAT-27264]OBZ14613.1 transcriptional regulator [Bacillus sp. FJAT-27264]
MDLKAYKTFQAIVSTGSFNRAAEELNYAQSTVTMQIQKLEAELGVQLLERGKQIVLTEAGRLFHEQGRQILKDIERLESDLAELHTGDAGSVRIGVTDPTATYRLPGLLKTFLNSYPRVGVEVEIAGTLALSERLLRGELDWALCSAPELGTGLYFEPLFTERFLLLLPEGHPLAASQRITPEDLREHRILITATHCPYRKKLESVLQEFGGSPLNTMVIGSMVALKDYVAAGLGIALVPAVMLNPVPPGTVSRQLAGTPIDMSCGILCKTAEYPLIRSSAKLYHFIREELMEQPASS